MNKKNQNPIVLYYLLIGLSTIALSGSIICIVLGGLCIFAEQTGRIQTAGFDNAQVTGGLKSLLMSVSPVIYVFLGCIGFIVYPFLTKKRQVLRDLVEYDENGLSRKHGSFSQLSRKEREAIDRLQTMDAERILSATTFKSIRHKGSEHCHEELDHLIGLQNVKERIQEMESRMEYEKKAIIDHKKYRTDTFNSMHMVFYGNPGTGKTTIARIMTGLLYEYGYIKKNQCVEIDGNFFHGLSIGESSKRANMLISKSKGGVIFIDEAYALLSNENGQEVIASIVKAMEDYRDELIFIFAGYEKEMMQLINSNPGIESRVKYHLHFEEYSLCDLKQIFKEMAHEKNLLVSEQLLNAFSNEIMARKRLQNFGNARTVRNILDEIIDKHAVNLKNGTVPEEDRYKLKECDF